MYKGETFRGTVEEKYNRTNTNSANMLQCKIKVKQKDEMSQQPVMSAVREGT